MTQRPTPTPLGTITELLKRSGRKAVPIRRTFLQSCTGDPKRGPLADLVRHHDERALEFYLLILAAASSDVATGAFDVTHHAAVWARALYLEGKLSAVSKILARLVHYRLVERDRSGRQAHITLLCEDGSGQPYTRPKERFFSLPHAYWLEQWNRKLRLPAKAALLIALSLPNDFFLPLDKAPSWYGVSSDTIEAGLRQLRDADLLERRRVYKEAPLTPQGFTTESHYTLKPPFGPRPYRPQGSRGSQGIQGIVAAIAAAPAGSR